MNEELFLNGINLSKNSVGYRSFTFCAHMVYIIYDTLLSEQFSTHFVVCCVATRSILKPTDTITKEYRQ